MNKVRRQLVSPPAPRGHVFRSLNHLTGEIFESTDFARIVQSTAESVAYSLMQVELDGYGDFTRVNIEFEKSIPHARQEAE